MAAKRFFDDSDPNQDQPNEKRRRTRPTLESVIGEVVVDNFFQKFCSALEPMLRRVVHEEVEQGVKRATRSLTRTPSLRIQALEPSSLQLKFNKQLSLPIFTGSKIVDKDNGPLQIILVDTATNNQNFQTANYYSPIKVEIVVLDGDFPIGDRQTWTSVEFNSNVVKERTGKRPLLTGDLQFTMREGFAQLGDLEFTDNSSWIRSRKFRLGARMVLQGSGYAVMVREAITESFIVKDHRGELYKKHHPPMLEDDVWRLEKIGKDGAFHKKLAAEHIYTVQDFLKLSVVDSAKLKKILGQGMSEKMWEVTVKHARTCVMGNKFYVFRGSDYTITMNPICQVAKAVINGQTYTSRDLNSIRAYIENLAREAYANWNTVEEVDGLVNETPLLTQGDMMDQYPNHNHHHPMTRSYHHQHALLTDGTMEGSSSMPIINSNANNMEECNNNEWLVTSTYLVMTPLESGCVSFNASDSAS